MRHSGLDLLTLSSSHFDPEETLWCHRLPLVLPAISVANTSSFGAQELWNRSVQLRYGILVGLAASSFFPPMIAAATAWFENNAVLPSAPPQLRACQEVHWCRDRRMGHIENIYRCRTAADWFVLRSEQTPNSHIFGESDAVLVSRLRH
jgi:hypothetical protein